MGAKWVGLRRGLNAVFQSLKVEHRLGVGALLPRTTSCDIELIYRYLALSLADIHHSLSAMRQG